MRRPDTDLRDRLDEAAQIQRREPTRALELAESVLAALGDETQPPAPRLRAEALVQIARSLLLSRRLEGAMEGALRASVAAADCGDLDTEVRARTLLGSVFLALGHGEAALEVLDDAVAESADPRVSLAARVSVRTTLGSVLRRLERFDDAIACFREAEALARQSGNRISLANVLVNEASAGWQAGRIEEASAALRESRALCEAEGRSDLMAWQDAIEAWVEAEAGHRDAAIARARAALANEDNLEPEVRVSATRALAHALVRAPEPAPADLGAARAVLEELVADARARGWTGDLPIIAREAAQVCRRLGDFEAGMGWLETAFDARKAADEELHRLRLTAETFRLRALRAQVEAEQTKLRVLALEASNRELEALGTERATLLSTVAHDLRSPLTAILLSVDYFRRSKGPDLPGLLAGIGQAAMQMTQVIDGALSTEAIRVGRSPVRPRQVDVADVVRRCLVGLGPLAERKRIELVVAAPVAVPARTDERALARIVENVVSNALKFTPEAGRVDVLVQTEGGGARIEVRDQGPGFAPGETEVLFELGRRGAARPTGGEASSGVGLHVVRDLVRALGGQVELANRPTGTGALVVVTLPPLPT